MTDTTELARLTDDGNPHAPPAEPEPPPRPRVERRRDGTYAGLVRVGGDLLCAAGYDSPDEARAGVLRAAAGWMAGGREVLP